MNDLVNLKTIGALLLNALFVISAAVNCRFQGTVGSLKSVFWIKTYQNGSSNSYIYGNSIIISWSRCHNVFFL